jgi:hypothetical protein
MISVVLLRINVQFGTGDHGLHPFLAGHVVAVLSREDRRRLHLVDAEMIDELL